MKHPAQSLAAGLVILVTASFAHADSISLDLNADAARLSFHHPFSHSGRQVGLEGGWLHSQDRGDLLHAGLHIEGNAGTGQHPVQVGLGSRLYYATDINVQTAMGEEDFDGGALTLGGFFRYRFQTLTRVGVFGHAYIAPDVLAFGDPDGFLEIMGRVNYDVLRDAWAYLGFRVVRVDLPMSDAHFDTGLHAGMEFQF